MTEIQNPKSLRSRSIERTHFVSASRFGYSDFGFVSYFEFRASNFRMERMRHKEN